MDGLDTGVLEVFFEPEIEIGRIDADEDVGPDVEQALLELTANAGNLAVVLQRVDIAHDRQLLERPPGVEALALHLRPADAVEHGIRQLGPERGNQVAGQEIPGGLARHHRNAYHVAHQRIMPRFETSRKSTKRCTSGCVLASSASFCLASSSNRPDL